MHTLQLHKTCTLYNYAQHAHFTITQDMYTLQLHKTCTLFNYTQHAHFTITQDMHTLQLHKTCTLNNYTRHAHFTITPNMHTFHLRSSFVDNSTRPILWACWTRYKNRTWNFQNGVHCSLFILSKVLQLKDNCYTYK